MARIKRDDWKTDFHVRYLAFRDRDAMAYLFRRQLGRARRERFSRFLRGWR